MNTTSIQVGTEEASQAQSQAIGWLIEMEKTTDPNFINAMLLNIYRISKRIIDAEIVIDSRNKRMLIWLELDRLGRWFSEKKVKSQVEAMLLGILPSYEFRVVYDKDILDRAVKILTGEYQNERQERPEGEQENISEPSTGRDSERPKQDVSG